MLNAISDALELFFCFAFLGAIPVLMIAGLIFGATAPFMLLDVLGSAWRFAKGAKLEPAETPSTSKQRRRERRARERAASL